MGKATKWFRNLLGLKKPDTPSPTTTTKPPPKRRWSFGKSTTSHHRTPSHSNSPLPPYFHANNENDQQHAIAVAEATAAVANAAVTAAQRAAEVVKLTSGDNIFKGHEYWAAVTIQSHFRAYLSRRALRALKGLVKLQALVRGHIVRKQDTEKLLQMQAALRARTRARVLRAQIQETSQSAIKLSHLNHPGPATPEKSEHAIRRSTKHEQSVMLKRNGSRSNFRVGPDKEKYNYHYSMDEGSWDRVYPTRSGSMDEGKSDKILEIDTGKFLVTPKKRNLFHSSLYPSASDPNSHSFATSKDSTFHQAILSPSSGEVQSLTPYNYTNDVDEDSFCTAETSPRFLSSKGGSFTKSGPFTPTRSDASKSCLSGYSDYYPNYMSYTESSKAKVRSLSAPRQRTQLDRSNTAKRLSLHNVFSDMRSSSTQRVPSALHSNFASKAYPGSGRLDRLGMPLGGEGIGFSGGLLNKY
ncbi:Protein IQ-DOMAIN like [Heracleum sosnowskyi]|uniref:Protein IQ-DOMAIN like n=1 Tax=Heracleum sosnowskyi TaxID=360622 RepID=A0AAD8GQM6_9APIA|nr:Protein IQ-DOMAIN like [Heracleum sosnowskyi]